MRDSAKLDWILYHLRRIGSKLNVVISGEEILMGVLDDLALQVQRNTDVEASAVVLIQGIAAKLAEAIAAGDPTRIAALQAQLASSADALAAAVVANTPAA